MAWMPWTPLCSPDMAWHPEVFPGLLCTDLDWHWRSHPPLHPLFAPHLATHHSRYLPHPQGQYIPNIAAHIVATPSLELPLKVASPALSAMKRNAIDQFLYPCTVINHFQHSLLSVNQHTPPTHATHTPLSLSLSHTHTHTHTTHARASR